MLNNMTAYALLSMDFIFREARRYYQRTVLESSFSYLLPFFIVSVICRITTLLTSESSFLVRRFSVNESFFIL